MRRILFSATASATIVALALFVVLRSPQPVAAQNAGAPDPPLNFGTNYFVTGDYVVAGAQGLNASFGNDGLGTGIISFPDGNPGIRGTTTVPKGANILAALLYWQTVEKVGVPGSGQNGFFGPVFTVNGKAQPPHLYPISGLNLPSHNAVSFSNGGCSGTSTGKIVQTYRTDVRGYLPLDANGNVLVNKADGVTFEVRLPNVGNNTPLTLGATLVLIYRVIDPNVPLNVITIYDGAFAPNATPNFTMSQPVQGFYQVAARPASRLTHIVGAGKSNKFQQAYLNGGQGANQRLASSNPLPSPYGNGQPAFPGFYGNWDNTTWVFPDANFPNFGNLANPLQENDDTANTMVVANGANPGCVSWSATIVSTTVHDDNRDGILQVWKQNQGYTDVATGQHVDLTGASTSQQDVFLQLDHVVDSNGDFTPDPVAVTNVTNAFLAHGVHLHISGGNAIQEAMCTDASIAPQLCTYPNQTGITTWRDGVETIKNQPLNYNTEDACEANSPPLVPIGPLNCKRRFPPAQRNSHHYAVWGDTLGGPNWTFLAGRLTDSTPGGAGAGKVVQTGANTVTFYTTRGHGLTVDAHAGNGRVTITGAITNPNLNGTHLVTGFSCQTNPDTSTPNDCSTNNKALGPYSFTISVGGNAGANYTLQTDPYLSVASGQAGAGSGFSDVGGADTLVTLFQWGANATLSAKEGTLLHELGHTLGLLHGGGDNTNCKSNYQSVMNYMFQAKLLGPTGFLDLSSQLLNPLDETSLGPLTTSDKSPIAFPTTRWYDTKQTLAFKQAAITSFSISSNVVIFQATNNFTAGNVVKITGLTSGSYLNGQMLTVLSAGLSGTQFQANFAHSDVASTADSGTARTTTPVPTGFAATAHCDGTSLTTNDPATYKYAGGTLKSASELDIPWSVTSLDANFEGATPGSEPKFFGYNDWANADYRQVGAGGNAFFSVPGGFVPQGPGGFVPFGPGGFVPQGPGGFVPQGPGGFVPNGPGGFVPGGPGISGGGGKVELDFATAVSAIDPPTRLTASEEASARIIDLNWDAITFPVINHYNIYRSADQGATFNFVKSVASPPAQDVVACNPNGYQYFVTAVFNNTAQITSFSITSNVVTFQAANNFTPGTNVQIAGLSNGAYLNGQVLKVLSTGLSATQFQAAFVHANVGSTADSGTATSTSESTASNVVSTGQNGEPLTGCYTAPVFSAPAAGSSPLQGSVVPVSWTVRDASNQSGAVVSNTAANTLVAIGPISNDVMCVPASVPANAPRSPIASAGAGITFNPGTNQFNFSWNTTLGFIGSQALNLPAGAFPPGCYLLEDDLDSGQPVTGNLPASAFQVQFYLSDSNESVIITTASPLPDATAGVPYTQTLMTSMTNPNEVVAPVNWTVSSGSLPLGTPNLTLNAVTGVVSGTPSTAGTYNFTPQVTDFIGDFGTKPFTLTVHIFVSDSQPPPAPPFTATTTLPNAVLGIPYNNTVYESGGVNDGTNPFTWTIVPNSVMPGGGSTLPGLSFQPNAAGVLNGTLSGTPTATGTFTFTAMVTDSAGNTGTQTFTLTITSAAGFLYVANGGGGNVSAYSTDASTGVLTPVPGSPFPAGNLPSGIAVDPFVYAANLDNTISAYSVDPSTGALNAVTGSPFASTGAPASIAVDPTGRFAYAANHNAWWVSGYMIDPNTGALAAITGSPFLTGGQDDQAVAVDPTGTYVYATNIGTNNISAYSIASATGALTLLSGSPFSTGTAPIGMAVHPTGPFVYVANHSDNTISGFSIDGTTGNLMPVPGSPFATGTSNVNGLAPRWVAVDPLGQFVFTANQGGNGDVSAFSINTTTGALTPVPGSPFAAGSQPFSVAVDATSSFAYVANGGSNNISAYTINRNTGALNQVSSSPYAAGSAPASLVTSNACAAFPTALIPFTTIFSIATDAAGDMFVVGGRPGGGIVAELQSVQLPSITNQRFCRPVTLETNYTVPAYVPTAAERGGDYSAYAGLTLIDPTTNLPFGGNLIPPGRLDTIFAWRIPKHSANLPRLSCSLEPALHSIEGAVQTSIQFVNNTAGPVNIYWINYNGQRIFYRGGPFATLAAGQSYVQGTFITHPWIVTDVTNNSCLGIWEPTESLGTAVITGSPSFVGPQPATNLSTQVQGTAPNESVLLTWNPSASNNVVGYNVYRGTAARGPYTKLTAAPTASPYTDSSVSSGQTYYYVVRAVDNNNVESPDSNQASAVVP